MILPGKHLRPDRALLGLGGEILSAVDDGRTVSELWESVQRRRQSRAAPISYDWFVVALSFLYAINAVSYEHGLIVTGEVPDAH